MICPPGSKQRFPLASVVNGAGGGKAKTEGRERRLPMPPWTSMPEKLVQSGAASPSPPTNMKTAFLGRRYGHLLIHFSFVKGLLRPWALALKLIKG